MTKLSFQTAISYMHHTTVYISRLHLQSRSGHYRAIVSASQHLEKAAMGIRNFGRTVTDNIATSWRRQWMRLRRRRYMVERELESGSRELLVRPVITQDTRPRPTSLPRGRYPSHTPSPSLGRYPPRPCPSFGMNVPHVSILDEEGFTPPGSPTGATLGIPAEHLLDEHEIEMDDLIQPVPLHFHNPFNTPQKQLRTLTDSDSGSGKTLSDENGGYIFLTPPRTESGSSGSDSPGMPQGYVGGTYRIRGQYIVYTCNHCGHGTGFYTRDQWRALGNPL